MTDIDRQINKLYVSYIVEKIFLYHTILTFNDPDKKAF